MARAVAASAEITLTRWVESSRNAMARTGVAASGRILSVIAHPGAMQVSRREAGAAKVRRVEEVEWDGPKARRSLTKHAVSFLEARSALRDPDRVTRLDQAHSQWEERYITVGLSIRLRLITVVTSETPWGSIRIISAWRATKRERHGYETRSL